MLNATRRVAAHVDALRAEGASGEGARKPVAGDGGVAGGACESEDAAAVRRRLGGEGGRVKGHTSLSFQSSSSRASSIPPSSSQSSLSQPETHASLALTHAELTSLQIRAFIEASEDVDIDPETLADLISSFPQEESLEDNLGSDDRESDIVELDLEGVPDSELELDVSALYSSPEQDRWTKQEVRQMMTALKERGMPYFVNEYVKNRAVPIPDLLRAFGINLCPELRLKRPATLLYFLRVAIARELRIREKLEQHNTIDDAVNLIRSSQRILILTGAGISVSCGIPDFRSRDGLYASLVEKPAYELDDPQQMFDISYFKENPAVFYSFASQIYPSNFVPSPCHRFIKLIEDQGKLLRNYTQNIDTLETLTGVRKVLQCHGSFATASCVNCRRQVPGSEIESDIMKHRVPLCPVCNVTPSEKDKKKKKRKSKNGWGGGTDDEDETDAVKYPSGIMKPDITFFGEKLTDDFDHALEEDRNRVDLLLVIGTSLKVSPVAEILSHLPHSIPQILINKTPVRHINPDIVLLGSADIIVEHLASRLNWEIPPPPPTAPPAETRYPARNMKKRSTTDSDDPYDAEKPTRVGNSHIWLYPGAEGGKWLEQRTKDAELSVLTSQQVPTTHSNGVLTNTSPLPDSRQAKRPRI